ncbi:MAG: Uma2 family endonuclease [Acidobacteria bacterium]|nr:Uma2 family endonuclease [Acidobacteriota bacterium]
MMSVAANLAEQRVVLRNVSWETYERLLKDLENSSAPRLTFDRGVLEIMSPLSEHEQYNRNLSLLIEVFAEEFDIDIGNLGSTTFKREDLDRGFEPDSCFYIQNEARIRTKRRIDAAVDPPPDLLIEIDLTSDSLNKFPIFARLGVPEIWRYSSDNLAIFTLHRGNYKEQDSSPALPPLTAADLTRLLESSMTMKRTAWLRHLRAHFRKLKSKA